jgi:hypothetical protein
VADLTPLRIGVTGSRRYASPAVIRSAFLAAHARSRPHRGHVLVHGQCGPFHPDTDRKIPWAMALRVSWEVQRRYLGGDWLAEQVALDMASRDGICWDIERYPADWCPAGKYDRTAGFRRNGEMVESGADEWLAFALPCEDHRCCHRPPHPSHGTAHCAGLAVDAGIPLYPFGADGPLLGGPGEWFAPHDDPGLWPDRGAMETAP